MTNKYCIGEEEIHNAAKRIHGIAKITPVLSNQIINNQVFNNKEGRVFFKVEAFQQTGSFKFRGALNAIQALLQNVKQSGQSDTINVVTHSSGNHAAALAFAAKCGGTHSSKNVEATIVMPKSAPTVKKDNTLRCGGKIVFVENTNEAREEMADSIQRSTGATFIHPSENPYVIAGQGTVSLEMIQQVRNEYKKELDIVIMPVGGGGLASGNTMILRSLLKDKVKIILAEPMEVDDAKRSKEALQLLPHYSDNKLNTIADGLKTTLGPNTWPIIRDLVDDIITVSEDDILKATKYMWETLKVCIEPSSAVSVAVLMGEEFQKKYLNEVNELLNIGVILSGGNVDIAKITERMKEL